MLSRVSAALNWVGIRNTPAAGDDLVTITSALNAVCSFG